MTVGEAPGMTPDIALEFIKEGDKQDLNMMFHFQHMEADCIGNACVHTGFKLKKLKKVMSTVLPDSRSVSPGSSMRTLRII